MVATAPSTLARPPAPGRSASRIASDRQGATWVSPENAAFEHLAHRLDHALATPCIGRARPHRGNSHPGRRRFSGQTRDGRYCRARYYHPQLQRFISEDPIGFEGGDVNLYAYVANAPLDFTDPSGMTLVPGTIPEYCRGSNSTAIPMTPALSGRKGTVAQIVAAELAFVGLVARVFECGSILGAPAAGIVSGTAVSLDALSKAAGVANRGGLTAAGRALAKHGGRPRSAFPAAKGNPAQINRTAQDIVDDILTSPGSATSTRATGRFGQVIEIRAPDGRGVRFGANGGFIGFLEP